MFKLLRPLIVYVGLTVLTGGRYVELGYSPVDSPGGGTGDSGRKRKSTGSLDTTQDSASSVDSDSELDIVSRPCPSSPASPDSPAVSPSASQQISAPKTVSCSSVTMSTSPTLLHTYQSPKRPSLQLDPSDLHRSSYTLDINPVQSTDTPQLTTHQIQPPTHSQQLTTHQIQPPTHSQQLTTHQTQPPTHSQQLTTHQIHSLQLTPQQKQPPAQSPQMDTSRFIPASEPSSVSPAVPVSVSPQQPVFQPPSQVSSARIPLAPTFPESQQSRSVSSFIPVAHPSNGLPQQLLPPADLPALESLSRFLDFYLPQTAQPSVTLSSGLSLSLPAVSQQPPALSSERSAVFHVPVSQSPEAPAPLPPHSPTAQMSGLFTRQSPDSPALQTPDSPSPGRVQMVAPSVLYGEIPCNDATDPVPVNSMKSHLTVEGSHTCQCKYWRSSKTRLQTKLRACQLKLRSRDSKIKQLRLKLARLKGDKPYSRRPRKSTGGPTRALPKAGVYTPKDAEENGVLQLVSGHPVYLYPSQLRTALNECKIKPHTDTGTTKSKYEDAQLALKNKFVDGPKLARRLMQVFFSVEERKVGSIAKRPAKHLVRLDETITGAILACCRARDATTTKTKVWGAMGSCLSELRARKQ